MASTAGNKILITGAPGVGKTTLIRRLVSALDQRNCTGFYTAEIREGNARKGFELVGLDGQKALLAHVEIDSPFRVGRYGVDVEGFDRFLAAIGFAHTDADVVIVDEIGKMEMFSTKFIQLLDTAFTSDRLLVATISAGGSPAIQRFKQHSDVTLFTVTRSNRDHLVGEIAALAADRR
jgi:nucleoside-triphosphatase